MRDMGYVEGTPAAICDTALQTLKVLYFKKYGEELTDEQALHVAGIKVKGSGKNDNHVSLQKYSHKFRHQDYPSRISEEIVHHGWVRNQVKEVLPCGEIIYSDKPHPLQSLYYHKEVVTGTELAAAWEDILTIGDIDDFRKGTKRDVKEFEETQQKVISQDFATRLLEFCKIDVEALYGDKWDEVWGWCRKLLYVHQELNEESLRKIPSLVKDVVGVREYLEESLEEYV